MYFTDSSDKIIRLLKESDFVPDEDVLTRIRQSNYFALRMTVLDTVSDAVAWFSEAKRAPKHQR